MKYRQLIFAALGIFSLLTSCSSEPEKGEKGDKGDTGQKGDSGENGIDGEDGSRIYTGSGLPSAALGVQGDIYIDTSNGDLYSKGEDWDKVGNIKGEKGDKGEPGENGSNGSNGSDGVSITNVYIDDNGHLICVMSDSSSIDAGSIKDVAKHTVNYYAVKDSNDPILINNIKVSHGEKISPAEFNVYNGYESGYWYTKEYGQKIPWSFTGCTVTSDVNLYIDVTPIEYAITYYLDGALNPSDNPSHYATVSETINLKDPYKKGYYFLGWYSDADYKTACSSIPQGSTGEKSFYAKFMLEEQATALGIAPLVNSVDKTLTYGLYPQDYVSSTDLTATLDTLDAESNGWYLLDGTYYVKKTASNYSDGSFSDGTTAVKGTSYWFKCKPITWDILSSSDGTYFIASDAILENIYWGDSNNYKNSNIRKVLNGSFYTAAFGLGDSLIQTVTIDNSAASTSSSTNNKTCENTTNKVYALSYQDLINTDYGFATSTGDSSTRMCKVTDYALACGVAVYDGTTNNAGYGNYATRSPISGSDIDISKVNYKGGISTMWNNDISVGIRPAMQIKIY